MVDNSDDRIEKTIDLKAPVDRVWRALTDHEEFGQWFRVKLDGPFVLGQRSTGQITYEGYEHMTWEADVTSMDKERVFAFQWCPVELDPGEDVSDIPPTLVEFTLEPIASGTRLTISESGFSALPDDRRRVDAMRNNSGGWELQTQNIAAHVET